MVLEFRDIRQGELYRSKEFEMSEFLRSYGVKTSHIRAEESGAFSYYYIRLLPGTKYSKLDGLLFDIGMHFKAISIPTGKMSLELGCYKLSIQTKPLASEQPHNIPGTIPVGCYAPFFLGTSHDEPIVRDMSKMPNMIIAGSSGSGKSSLLHSIAISAMRYGAMLYISDPKMVEFSEYKDFRYTNCLVSDYAETLGELDSLINIMNKRFAILKKRGVRSAAELALRNKTNEVMQPIIFIIDEWADLSLQGKEISQKLLQLSQKGRASGISIVLATQHPSANIISSAIKANFPGRVALRTANAAASRMIIGKNGAEGLYSPGQGFLRDYNTDEPIYFQAPLVSSPKEEAAKCGLKTKKSFLKSIFK